MKSGGRYGTGRRERRKEGERKTRLSGREGREEKETVSSRALLLDQEKTLRGDPTHLMFVLSEYRWVRRAREGERASGG